MQKFPELESLSLVIFLTSSLYHELHWWICSDGRGMYWHKEKNTGMHAQPSLDGIITDNPNESKPIV